MLNHTSFDTVHVKWVRKGNLHIGCINGYQCTQILRKPRKNNKPAYIAYVKVIGWGTQLLPLGSFDSIRAAKLWVHNKCNIVNAQALQIDMGSATIHCYRALPQ